MARPESGDRKRQVASVYVWTRVTSGERDLRHTSNPRSHYARFRAELDAFAAALAKTIDTSSER